jgi:hypothetical protein
MLCMGYHIVSDMGKINFAELDRTTYATIRNRNANEQYRNRNATETALKLKLP